MGIRRFAWRVRVRLKWKYLQARKRVIPWCIMPGCWEASSVSPVRIIRGRRMGGRGNVCAVHAMQNLLRDIYGMEDM